MAGQFMQNVRRNLQSIFGGQQQQPRGQRVRPDGGRVSRVLQPYPGFSGNEIPTPGGYSSYNNSPYQTPQGTAGSGFYDPFQQFGQGVTRGQGLRQAQDWSNQQLQNLPDPNATPQGIAQWLGMSPRTGPPRTQQGSFGSPVVKQQGGFGDPGSQMAQGSYGMGQQGGQLPRFGQGQMPNMMDYANYYMGQNQQQGGQMPQKDMMGNVKQVQGQPGGMGQMMGPMGRSLSSLLGMQPQQQQVGQSNAFDFRNPANINRGTQAQQQSMQAYQQRQQQPQQQGQPSMNFMGNLMQSMNPQQLLQFSQSGGMPQGMQMQRRRQF